MSADKKIRWKILPWQMIRWLNQTTGRLRTSGPGLKTHSRFFTAIYLVRGFIGVAVLNVSYYFGMFAVEDNADRIGELLVVTWKPWLAISLPALSVAIATLISALILLVIHTGDKTELAAQLWHPVQRATTYLALLSFVAATVSLQSQIGSDLTSFPLQLLFFIWGICSIVVAFGIVFPMMFLAPFTTFGAADGHLMMPALVIAIAGWTNVGLDAALEEMFEFDFTMMQPLQRYLFTFMGPVSISLIAIAECLYLSARFGIRLSGKGVVERY